MEPTSSPFLLGAMAAILLTLGLPLSAWSQPKPPNDRFADAIAISGAAVETTGSNVGATLEPGEPQILVGSNGGMSVWWVWTAPEDGTVTIDTIGSAFDTLLGGVHRAAHYPQGHARRLGVHGGGCAGRERHQ